MTVEKKKLIRLSAGIMFSSQILFVVLHITGLVIRVTGVEGFSMSQYYTVWYLPAMLPILAVCLIVAGILRPGGEKRRALFTGCGLMILYQLISAGRYTTDNLIPVSELDFISLDYILEMACQYIYGFTLIGAMVCIILFTTRRKGRGVGKILAAISTAALLPQLYSDFAFLIFSSRTVIDSIDFPTFLLIVNNSFFTVGFMLLNVGILVWFYACGWGEGKGTGEDGPAHLRGSGILLAGSIFFLIGGLSGLGLCFANLTVDFYSGDGGSLLFSIAVLMLASGIYGIFSRNSRRNAKTCFVIGLIFTIYRSLDFMVAFFDESIRNPIYLTAAAFSLAMTALYMMGGWKNRR